MGCVNTTQFFPNLFVLGTLSSKRWENIGKSTLGFTGLTQIWERIGKYSSYLKNSLGIKLGILVLKQVMEEFWEKLARGNFKLLRTGSFSTVNIFGLTFWVIYMIFTKSWILRKQRRSILNTRLVLIVLLKLRLYNNYSTIER